jgi:hypothetical protein
MSFINNYDEIKAQIEERIDNIDGLSATDAALVAAAAQLLNGRNQPIANMQALLTYLQNRQDGVDDDTTIKDIVLLLGASMGSKNVVWRMQEFLSDGTFTVPNNIAGDVVYVTGSGGGASGSARVFNTSTAATSTSGNSGCYIYRQPVNVNAGAVISVAVGAGGAAATITAASGNNTAAANAGQASVFGTLTIPGGDATTAGGGGWRSGYSVDPTIEPLPENSIAYKAGLRSQSGNATALGSAAGAYGNGCDGATATGANVTATSAAANSGAAGGSAAVINNTAGSLTATSGAGGSGRIIVEWQEFV